VRPAISLSVIAQALLSSTTRKQLRSLGRWVAVRSAKLQQRHLSSIVRLPEGLRVVDRPPGFTVAPMVSPLRGGPLHSLKRWGAGSLHT
jgi:hypothetical protein